MNKLSEEQAAVMQAMVDLAEKWYNNTLPQDDRVRIKNLLKNKYYV